MTRFSAAWLEHLRTPRHLAPVGGPPWPAAGVGVMEGPRLSTSVTVWVGGEGEGDHWRITTYAWRVDGVPEAVPAASALGCLVAERGPTASEAAALEVGDLAPLLGGVPAAREYAALLPLQALRRALHAAGVLGASAEEDDDRACHCVGLRYRDLRLALQGDPEARNLQRRTSYGTGCGTCVPAVHAYLEALLGLRAPAG